MNFKISLRYYFLLSIISILLFNSVQGKKAHFKKVHSKNTKKSGENYYIIVLDHKANEKNGLAKREEKEKFINSFVSEVNRLIDINKDTYENQSALENFRNGGENSLKKRSEKNAIDYAHVISTLENDTLIHVYLSEDLVPVIKNLPNVKSFGRDIKMKWNSHNNLKNIKYYTKWDNICVKGDTYTQLSLISQGPLKTPIESNEKYDTNYYYPSSAGEGINIFLLDSGFDFGYSEFDNSYQNDKYNGERDAKCLFSVDENGVYEEEDEIRCMYHQNYHGNHVADVAGGINFGVAPKANIYGVVIQRDAYNTGGVNFTSVLKALQYISDNYLYTDYNIDHSDTIYLENYYKNISREEKKSLNKKFINKTIINISSSFDGFELDDTDGEWYNNRDQLYFDLVNHLGELFNVLTSKGAVIVASAGNDEKDVTGRNFPCDYDDVICVGAVDNIGINDTSYRLENYKKSEYDGYKDHNKYLENLNILENDYYRKGWELMESKIMNAEEYKVASFSNYGERVDLFAPGIVKTSIKMNGKAYDYYITGTSFSSPIVAGVAATIMSEFPDIKFNTRTMKSHLQYIALKGVVKGILDTEPNYFINNGNYLNFEKSDEYKNCGNFNEICNYDREITCSHKGCCLK